MQLAFERRNHDCIVKFRVLIVQEHSPKIEDTAENSSLFKNGLLLSRFKQLFLIEPDICFHIFADYKSDSQTLTPFFPSEKMSNKRYTRSPNLLKVKVYEHNEEHRPGGRIRTQSSILKSFELESRKSRENKKVRIQEKKPKSEEKSDDEFSLLKKFNKPISPLTKENSKT